MHDNQIEVLSKAIDSLVQVRKMVGLIGRKPELQDNQILERALANIYKASHLVACLEAGEEWQP